MDEIIVASLQGKTTPVQERRLERWRHASLANERRYRELVRIWEATSPPKASSPAPAPPSAASVIRRFERPARRRPGFVAGLGRIWARPLVRWSAAAAIIAASVLTVRSVGPPAAQDLAAVEFRTGADESIAVTLSDGSIVQLGPESRLRFAATIGAREAELRGQAFFAVARNERHPFYVRTPLGTAQALGTRFDVRVRADDFRVVVVDGRVAVSVGNEAVELGEGEMSVASHGSEPAVARVANVYDMLDWMGTDLVFHSTPVGRALREIEYRFGRPIRLMQDPPDRTVTASFRQHSFEEVLTVVCRVVHARCEVASDRATVSF